LTVMRLNFIGAATFLSDQYPTDQVRLLETESRRIFSPISRFVLLN
jgi:hypothetical protein